MDTLGVRSLASLETAIYRALPSSVDFRYSHSLLLMVYSVTLYVKFPSACVHERPSMKQKREVVLLEKEDNCHLLKS